MDRVCTNADLKESSTLRAYISTSECTGKNQEKVPFWNSLP